MTYGILLNNMIIEKGYTFKEFLEECEKRGKKIDKGNFSRLINGKAQPPKEEISRMFANICNSDERLLIIEGYLDVAPVEIKEIFLSLKLTAKLVALNLYENKIEKQEIEEMEKQMRNEPLAYFVLSLLNGKTNNINTNNMETDLSNVNEKEIKLILQEPIAISVKDNAMFPIIQEGAEITLKYEDFKSGDILAVKIKGQEDFIVRYAIMNENEIVLKPLNNKFETLTYKLDDITILGKVAKVITEI